MKAKTRLVIFSMAFKQFATSIKGQFLSSSLSALSACSLSLPGNAEINNLLGYPIGVFAV